MNKPILVIFIIVIAAVMLGSTSITQSYAAKKINEVDTTIGPVVIGDDIPICGTTTHLEILFDIHSIIWDNDKYMTNIKATLTATDPISGELIGKGTETDMATGLTTESLDHTYEHKYQMICKNGAPNDITHEGYTLHKDGTVSVHHE